MTKHLPLRRPLLASCATTTCLAAEQPDTAATGFFDADRHNEASTLLCADSLRMGKSNAAFMFADRRCRVVTPCAYDLLLRATASRLMNETRTPKGTSRVRSRSIQPTIL